MKFCPNEKNLIANILKSKCTLTLILSMCKWSNVLNKHGHSYDRISRASGAINLKLSQITPNDKRFLCKLYMAHVINLHLLSKNISRISFKFIT